MAVKGTEVEENECQSEIPNRASDYGHVEKLVNSKFPEAIKSIANSVLWIVVLRGLRSACLGGTRP